MKAFIPQPLAFSLYQDSSRDWHFANLYSFFRAWYNSKRMKDESLPRGDRSLMNDDITGNGSMVETQTDWGRLRQRRDEDIHAALEADADIYPTDETFWQDAKVVMPRRKAVVTIRLDADLLEWLRQEKGYQTRINAVLRAYMAAQAGQQTRYNHPNG